MTDDHETALDALPEEQKKFLASTIDRLAQEFSGIYNRETIERYVYGSLSSLSSARITDFLVLFTERFARDRLWSLAKAEGQISFDKPTIFFLCVHNAGRSQMAAAWLDRLAGDRVRVMSGGSTPGSEVNPNAVEVMREVDIDLSKHFPKPWTEEVVRAADVVISMGCDDACPIFPGTRYEEWDVADPSGEGLEAVRRIRDELRERVLKLLESLEVETDAEAI